MTNYSQLTCGRRYQISRWLVTLASIQTRYVLAGHVRSKHAEGVLLFVVRQLPRLGFKEALNKLSFRVLSLAERGGLRET